MNECECAHRYCYFFSKAEKLQLVDQAFSERAEKENEAWGSQAEQKIAGFQRKCEERKKAELEAEVRM